MVYNIDMRISRILEKDQAATVIDRFLPGMRAKVEGQPAVAGMTLRKLAEYAKGAIPEKVLAAINTELGKIELDREETAEEMAEQLINQPLTKEAAEQISVGEQTAIYPGRPWRDKSGKRIQAHGGALFYEDGTYYWYGENKDRTDGKCSIWTWGIRAYASKDLYNWEDKGLIIQPNLMNLQSNLHPTMRVDRPHILKCENTKKYVCWIKLSGEEACFVILQADTFLGPYEVVVENYRPFEKRVGDFDVIKEEESGKAYLFMDADHEGIIGLELSEDFLRVVREVSRQYTGLHAPFCREAVALFERSGKKYMLTSGMSGYIPNKSDAAVSDSWISGFVSIGNPHLEDGTNSSYNSQISQIFKVPGKKDLYISIADRWVPGYPVDAAKADMIERAIAAHYEPERYQVGPEEKKALMDSPMLASANTSIADYVWLPLEFDEEKVSIKWQDEWRLEDYE